MAGLFISFLAKVVQSRRKKNYKNEKFAFSRAIIFYKNVLNKVVLMRYSVESKLKTFGKINGQ